jgi:hypothetical protein
MLSLEGKRQVFGSEFVNYRRERYSRSVRGVENETGRARTNGGFDGEDVFIASFVGEGLQERIRVVSEDIVQERGANIS